VLADETRRRIVELLARRSQPAGVLAGHFPISQPAVSRHLRVLREAGLVRVEVAGQQRVYHLVPGPLRELEDWLVDCRGFWSQRLDALETEIVRGRRASRPGGGNATDQRTTGQRTTDRKAR